MKNNRVSYRKNDLDIFKQLASHYLSLDNRKKSMNELCEYLGITRQTLSKYKQRNSEWSQSIDEIKKGIRAYNFLSIEKTQADLTYTRLEQRIQKDKEKEIEIQHKEYIDKLKKGLQGATEFKGL